MQNNAPNIPQRSSSVQSIDHSDAESTATLSQNGAQPLSNISETVNILGMEITTQPRRVTFAAPERNASRIIESVNLTAAGEVMRKLGSELRELAGSTDIPNDTLNDIGMNLATAGRLIHGARDEAQHLTAASDQANHTAKLSASTRKLNTLTQKWQSLSNGNNA